MSAFWIVFGYIVAFLYLFAGGYTVIMYDDLWPFIAGVGAIANGIHVFRETWNA